MLKVLVTGCAGFIGSHLVERLLDRGDTVVGIDCFTDYYRPAQKRANIVQAAAQSGFTLVENDILDMEQFPEVDCVYHLAAQPGVRASWGENFTVYTRNNVEATQRLLESYRSAKLRAFIYASSSSVYGDAKLPMNEEARPVPISPYGVTKLAAENLCYLYWKNYGVPTISLRYFTVYGPRQRPDMAIHRFVHAILSERAIPIYGDGEQLRDFTFIDDVIDAIVRAADSGNAGEIFNVGGGHTTSVNALIKKIEDISGKSASVRYEEQQKGDVKDTLADISKATRLLSWKPQTDIETGLKAYIDWVMTSSLQSGSHHASN
jgi:nucleoside-diphosphate-sugar epimerase